MFIPYLRKQNNSELIFLPFNEGEYLVDDGKMQFTYTNPNSYLSFSVDSKIAKNNIAFSLIQRASNH
jgi:hypothetical protein